MESECHDTIRKQGPKPKLNTGVKRMLLRTLNMMRLSGYQITVMSLIRKGGLDPTLAHRRIFSKYLNALRSKFQHDQREGLLSHKDKKTRFGYARNMKKTAQIPRFLCESHIILP